MPPIEIRSGLRKLEFTARDAKARQQEAEHVLVEFVRETALAPRETVRVALGLRDGFLRELVGHPQLIETKQSANGTSEYHYRLRGAVATEQN